MFPRSLAMLAAGLLLAACSSASVLYQDRLPGGIESWYSYGAAGRDLPLTVVGNPFPMPDADFHRAVERAVQVQTLLAPTRPRLTPSDSARPPFRLVAAFAPLSGGVCATDAVAQDAKRDTFPLHLGFCRADKIIAEVVSTGGGIAGPNDPKFQDLVGQAMLALFRPDVKDWGFCPQC